MTQLDKLPVFYYDECCEKADDGDEVMCIMCRTIYCSDCQNVSKLKHFSKVCAVHSCKECGVDFCFECALSIDLKVQAGGKGGGSKKLQWYIDKNELIETEAKTKAQQKKRKSADNKKNNESNKTRRYSVEPSSDELAVRRLEAENKALELKIEMRKMEAEAEKLKGKKPVKFDDSPESTAKDNYEDPAEDAGEDAAETS